MDTFGKVDPEPMDREKEKKTQTQEDLEERVVEHVEKLGKIRETLSDEKKVKIVQLCSDVEYNMIKCRREINQFDMLIVGIIDILNIK